MAAGASFKKNLLKSPVLSQHPPFSWASLNIRPTTSQIILVYLGISSIKHRPVKVTCVKKIRVVHEKTRLLT